MEERIVYQFDKVSLQAVNIEESEYRSVYKKFIFEDKAQLIKSVYFALISGFKHKIFCVMNEKGEIVHYTFLIPHCAKFSFMGKDDVQMGPSWTREDCRGRGISRRAFVQVCSEVVRNNENAKCYGLVRASNLPSVKALQNAKFVPVGKCGKTKYLKHYKKVEYYI